VCLISVVRPYTHMAAAEEEDILTPQNYEARPTDSPGRSRSLSWFALAALASYELVAITNHLTQDIPSVPMMWVLPLAIYLLTFALCFDGDRWYAVRTFRVAILLALVSMCWILYEDDNVVVLEISIFLIGLFVVCM